MADLAAINIPVNTSQINMAIAQTTKLENQLVKLERARRRGIITDQQFASSLTNVSKRMNRFAVDTQQAEQEILRFGNALSTLDAKGLNNVGRGLGESTKGFARFGLGAQQAGYQVGDFFVQIASGTNPMVAFTQQFSQLAGFFGGPWGAVVGAIAAIGGAAYIAFTGATQDVEEFSKALDDLKKQTDEQQKENAARQGGFSDTKQLEVYNQIKSLQEEINKLEKEKGNLVVSNYSGAQMQINASKQEREEKEKELQARIDALRASIETAEKDKEIALHADLIKQGMTDASIKLAEMSGVDLSNISDAAIDAANLAASLGIALSDAYSLQNLRDSKTYSGRGGNPADFMEGGSQSYSSGAHPFVYEAPKKTAGGGSKADPREQLLSQYNSLMGSLDPLIAAQNAYNDSLSMLNEALAKGAINQTQFQAGLDGIKKRLEDAKDPLFNFRKGLEDALDPNKNYMKGLQALQNSLSQFLFNPFEVGIQGMVYGFAQALQKMASDALAAGIIKNLLGMGAGASGGIGSSIISWLGSANGNVFNNGYHVQAFANGGVVNGPMNFPMKGGKMGLMGEAGPEAIMPLKRGADGKLGVVADGGVKSEKNTRIINVLDPSIVGQYLNTPDGEEVIMNVMRRTGVL